MSNYSYVIDSTFQPFSMQEMLVPFTAYKEAFEKTEEAYTDLSDKSDKFKYLSETLPEGSKARALYEGYANDLRQRAEDLAHNGLTMGNRRALTSMKRRYQGEIGRLSEADERLKEERKLRQTLNAQDSSRIYSTENLSIDDFLDNNNPNLYSVSGKELYAAGAAAGKAASSRVFSVDGSNRTLNDYYIDYVQKMGYSPETIQRFYEDMSTIPELQRAAADIATQYGVDKNLTGYGLERATKNILRGMMDGAVYQESHSPQRDLGKMTAAEQTQADLSRRSQDIELASNGMTYDDKTKTVSYDPTKDPTLAKARAVAEAKANAKKGTSGTDDRTVLNSAVRISWNGNNPKDSNGEADTDFDIENISTEDTTRHGSPVSFDNLPAFAKNQVRNLLGATASPDDYVIYFQPFESGWLNDTEATLEIEPKNLKKISNEDTLDFGETKGN